MRDAVLLHTTLTADEVMGALREHSRAWRESTLPAQLRREGITSVDFRSIGTSFTLKSRWGRQRTYRSLLAGDVAPATDGTAGSIVRLTVRPTLGSRIGLSLWVAWVVLISIFTTNDITPWVAGLGFCLVGIAFGCVMYAIGYRIATGERAGLIAWVATAIRAEASPQNPRDG